MTALAWHIARKDLRQFWWPFAAWIGCMAGDLVLAATGVDRVLGVGGSAPAFDYIRLGLSVCTTLLSALLAIVSTQADATIGTTASWLTRPISRGTLLFSKLLVISMAVGVPALAQVAGALLLGAGPGLAWHVLLEALSIQAVVVVPVAACAAVTRETGRFALASLGAWIALPVLMLSLSPLLSPPWTPVPLDSEPVVAAMAAAVLLAIAVIAHQFLTRRARRSAALAAVSLVLVAATAVVWRWPWMTLAEASFDGLAERSEIAVTLDPARMSRSTSASVTLWNGWTLAGLPSDTLARLVRAESAWSAPGQAVVMGRTEMHGDSPGPGVGWGRHTSPRTRTSEAVLASVLDSRLFNGRDRPEGPNPAVANLARSDADRLGRQPVTFETHLWFRLVRLRVVARLPLQPGGRAALGARHLSLVNAEPTTDGMRIVVRSTDPILWWSRVPDVTWDFALVNRDRREAALAAAGMWVTTSGASNIRSRLIVLDFSPGFGRTWTLSPEWLAGAELVVIGAEPGDLVQRTVKLDGVRLADFGPQATAAAPQPPAAPR